MLSSRLLLLHRGLVLLHGVWAVLVHRVLAVFVDGNQLKGLDCFL